MPRPPASTISRAALILVMAAAIAAGALPAGLARADTTFRFYGSGYGHQIGMSQWGAYGMARAGKSGTQILKHFYRGTSVARPSSRPSTIRVGLVQGAGGIGVKGAGGSVSLRVGGPSRSVVARIPSGSTWTVQVRSGAYWIRRSDGSYVGRRGYGGSGSHLFATYGSSGAYLPSTGHTYGHGWIEFNIYRPCGSCSSRLRAVNTVGMQGYLYGLGEVPSLWPSAALRAQAVAGRTYAYYKILTSGQRRAICNCAVYASTRDQVYVGVDKVRSTGGGRWRDAVDATNGLAVIKDGKPILAVYSSSSGGHTENVENVWGGSALSYLRGVCDRWVYNADPNRTWTASFSGASIGNALQRATGKDIGEARRFSSVSRGVSGAIVKVTVGGTSGSVTVSGSTLRTALGLKSTRVWINQNRNIVGKVRTKYDSLNCAPRLPRSGLREIKGGQYQAFRVGRIYVNDAVGRAHWIHGPVLAKYRKLGGHGSSLGLPTSDVVKFDSVRVRARFQRGTITCNKSTGNCTT
ncbi:MAG: SpoIID/LytB domain-containing protein [Actinomycetota bacterium]|nr:SpoIID/LytB domain-containing protein [Actinomycetota bacterium]